MLLRTTRADQVKRVYEQFICGFQSLEALSIANIEHIREVIYPLGMYSRSKWILYISKKLNLCSTNQIQSNAYNLEKALGKNSWYILNAIKCFTFGENTAIFDVNIKRILERIFSIQFGKKAHKSN